MIKGKREFFSQHQNDVTLLTDQSTAWILVIFQEAHMHGMGHINRFKMRKRCEDWNILLDREIHHIIIRPRVPDILTRDNDWFLCPIKQRNSFL